MLSFANYVLRIVDFLRKMPTPKYDGEDLFVDEDGWLHGPTVTRMPMHATWFYDKLATKDGYPLGLLWHYSATKHKTAMAMARARLGKRNPKKDRAASWHLSVEGDGSIVQMASLHQGTWHCGRGQIKDGPSHYPVNRCLVGIELIGFGKEYTREQIATAIKLVTALSNKYGWAPGQCRHEHRDFDPDRRTDCGPPWTDTILPHVISNSGLARQLPPSVG